MNKNISWNELKLVNGVWGYSEDNKEYSVFKTDGNRTYNISFDKAEYDTEGTDCKDFLLQSTKALRKFYKPHLRGSIFRTLPHSDTSLET